MGVSGVPHHASTVHVHTGARAAARSATADAYQVTVLSWKDTWLLQSLNETLYLGIFATIAYAFRIRRPAAQNPNDGAQELERMLPGR